MQKYRTKILPPINNFIYLYHTETLLMLPGYPTSITDNSSATFASETPLGRTAPIFSYSNSGPRSLQIQLDMHREYMNQINYANSWGYPEDGDDYVDLLIKQIQAAVLPNYAASEKLIDPPLVAMRIGDDIYIKGVINGGVGVSYGLPILDYYGKDKYAQVGIGFQITEVNPYDAETVLQIGSYREVADIPLNTSLGRGTMSAQATKFKQLPKYPTFRGQTYMGSTATKWKGSANRWYV